jgi:hypothetical protein
MSTTYRDVCGSLRGMIAHQVAGERPCGWCAQAETAARLGAEAVTWRPAPAGAFEPVTADQATVNRAVLEAAVEAHERGHGAANVVPYRGRGRAA